jgi:NTP pyrophosphatase (non-canonical NTP hydrolase)
MRDLEQLKERLRAFARERDWEQYHSPKNLSMALIVEAAELVEHFQWLTEAQSHALVPETRAAVEQEVADVFVYLVRLADLLGIDLLQAAEQKIALNEQKYPADRVRGSAAKYHAYTSEPRPAKGEGEPDED